MLEFLVSNGRSNWCDANVAETSSCAPRTVFGIRERVVEQGLPAAPSRKEHTDRSDAPSWDGHKQACVVQIACGR
jgi:hypothetical protein